MIIYKITNKINSKCYIGQTKQPLNIRWGQHARLATHSTALKNAIQKYGRDSFSVECIGTYNNIKDLVDAEMYFIDYHNSIAPNGYNLTEGGEAPRHSEAAKQKLSEAKMGPKNHMFGKKQSEETKAKRNAALTGQKRSPETIAKLKASHNPISNKNLMPRQKKAA